jgi:hypothetical protein
LGMLGSLGQYFFNGFGMYNGFTIEAGICAM